MSIKRDDKGFIINSAWTGKVIDFAQEYPKLGDDVFTTIRLKKKCDYGDIVLARTISRNRRVECVGVFKIQLNKIPLYMLHRDLTIVDKAILFSNEEPYATDRFNQMLKGMRVYYPNIQQEDDVWVHIFNKEYPSLS